MLFNAALKLLESNAPAASGPTNEERMAMSDLDGFLTAVAIGPEEIPLSEWLDSFWGDEPPTFESDEEMEAVLAGIFGHYNAILNMLANDADTYEPLIFDNSETGEKTVEAWARGFLSGVALRSQGWRALLRCEDRTYFAPIALFMTDENGQHVVARGENPEVDEIRANISDHIPAAVVGMYHFFRRNRSHFEGRTKLGRNDPCFCGSGKKFKKCCGAGR